MDTFFDDWPFYSQVALVLFLLALSGFFSMAETSMLSSNRHRLRAMATSGNKGAALAERLLKRIDSLLSVLLISNNLINTILPILVTGIALHIFGDSGLVLSLATLVVALLIIIFSEITPKVIGAAFPEKIASKVGWFILPLTFFLKPLLWFINSFVSGLMKVSGLQSSSDSRTMSKEELRSLVLESNRFVSNHHRNILLNLFNLENITVDDVMTPRSKIEILDLARPIEEVVQQLETCYHNKLLVHEGEINKIVGILHVRKAMALLNQVDELTVEHFRELLTPPYFIPPETDLFTQLQYFQENQERLAVIVDEYGEVQGLVTLDDIIEEMVGEFTTSTPGATRADQFGWDKKGECLLEGSISLRDVNKRLDVNLPIDGPKTLNGLLLELLQEIPEASVSLKISGCVIEIVQVQEQVIKMVKLYRPR
jgi:Mg2+/Co2+ transporter CorB